MNRSRRSFPRVSHPGVWGNRDVQPPEDFLSSDWSPGQPGLHQLLSPGEGMLPRSGIEGTSGAPGTSRAYLGGGRCHLSPSPGTRSPLHTPSPACSSCMWAESIPVCLELLRTATLCTPPQGHPPPSHVKWTPQRPEAFPCCHGLLCVWL